MPKFCTAGMLNMLNQPMATKPFIVVQISWGIGSDFYSTREQAGCNANIISFGDCANQLKESSSANCGSVSITMSDTDSALKFVWDVRNPERAPAAIYLAYDGMPSGDWMLLMRGNVCGPARWNEGDRQISFDIEIHTDDSEIGYSATEEDFFDINPEAIGIPWPMMFGTCCHVPTLHIRKKTVGFLQVPARLYESPSFTLAGGFTLKDNPTVYSYLSAAAGVPDILYIEGGDKFPSGEIQIMILDVIFKGSFSSDTQFNVTQANWPRYTDIDFDSRDAGDPDFNNEKVAWLDSSVSIVNSHCYLTNGAYNYCTKQIGNKCWFRFQWVNPVNRAPIKISNIHTIEKVYGISKNGMEKDIEGYVRKVMDKIDVRLAIAGKQWSGILQSTLNGWENAANSWWQASADEEVKLWDENPDIYLASLVELSEIKAVYGKRKIQTPDGKTKTIFAEIPSDYYEIQLQANYPILGMTPSAILFYDPLSSFAGQDWEEDVYVSGRSTVGPNPARIIEWVINNWTAMNPSASSFNVAADDLDDGITKANFTLFDKRETLKFCEEIAFQSRSGLIIDSANVAMIYLAKEPDQQWAFDENNTEFKSLDLGFTPLDNITTKLIATWSESYREKLRLAEIREKKTREFENLLSSLLPNNRRTKSDTRLSVYMNNIDRYGLRIREESCYIFCSEEPVLLFLDFWGNRFSQSWRTIQIKTPMIGARLLPFDGSVYDYDDLSLIDIPIVKGIVQAVSFSLQDLSVTVETLLPIASGETHVDGAFWPG